MNDLRLLQPLRLRLDCLDFWMMVFLMMSTRDLVSRSLPANVWASMVMVLGGGCVMSLGRTEWQVVCSEDQHLLLYCRKVGLVFKKGGLAFGVGLGKVGYIGSRTGIVDAGVSKSSFLVVQGLHGVGEERAKVRPGVLAVRLCIPSATLQGELWEQLHVVNAS